MNEEELNTLKDLVAIHYPEKQNEVFSFLQQVFTINPEISLDDLINIVENMVYQNEITKEADKNKIFNQYFELGLKEYGKILEAIDRYKVLDLKNAGDFDTFIREFSFFLPEETIQDIKKTVKSVKNKDNDYKINLSDLKVFIDQHFIQTFTRIKLEHTQQ
jgi:hypothetical protein